MSGDGDEVLYAELAGDLRRRSHRAFERIFKEMGPRLYRFAFSYLMNAEMAEDVVQDTFMHFWSVLGTLPEDTRVSTYLYASVKNSCLNYYKHLRVEDTNRTKLTEALIYMGSLQYEEGEDLFGKVQTPSVRAGFFFAAALLGRIAHLTDASAQPASLQIVKNEQYAGEHPAGRITHQHGGKFGPQRKQNKDPSHAQHAYAAAGHQHRRQ